MKRSRGISAQNSKGVETLFKKYKITWIKGTGTLAGAKKRRVQDADGKRRSTMPRRRSSSPPARA
jgi:dihydrolipoamide dehydrogenase